MAAMPPGLEAFAVTYQVDDHAAHCHPAFEGAQRGQGTAALVVVVVQDGGGGLTGEDGGVDGGVEIIEKGDARGLLSLPLHHAAIQQRLPCNSCASDCFYYR